MPTLTIRFKVPIVRDGNSFERASGGITFAAWLPEARENAVRAQQDNLTCEIWFEKSIIKPTITEIPDGKYWTPMEAQYALGMITIEDVSEHLVRYIETIRTSHDVDAALEKEHLVIARAAANIIVNTFNRIVIYVRNQLGQYWVTETVACKSAVQQCLRFNCRVPIDEGWLVFAPRTDPDRKPIRICLGGRSRHLDETKWRELCEFVREKKRLPRYTDLYAGAEEIESYGHDRAALVEAVAALESALKRFAQSPNAEKIYGDKLKGRLDGAILSRQIEHMGLSGSISFLLPVILDEGLLSTKTVEGCRKAIEIRNNVIHNGQKNISSDAIRECFESIRDYCHALEIIINGKNG